MARQLKWRNRLYEIQSNARSTSLENWTRVDIESLFSVSRGSAQTIMRAIGDVYDIGGKHFVSRASLLTYIEAVIKADDPALAHRARLDVSHAKPRPRPIGQEIPKELRSVMVRDLPTDITLEPGRLEIRGPNAERIVEMLVLLAQALQNDLHTATQLLDPPRIQLEHVDLELRAMFAELRAKENEHQLAKARSSVCTAVKTGGS